MSLPPLCVKCAASINSGDDRIPVLSEEPGGNLDTQKESSENQVNDATQSSRVVCAICLGVSSSLDNIARDSVQRLAEFEFDKCQVSPLLSTVFELREKVWRFIFERETKSKLPQNNSNRSLQKDMAAVEKAKAGGKVTVSDWSAEERAKFRTIATSQWVKVAERSPNAKKVYDVLTTYLKTNGLMN